MNSRQTLYMTKNKKLLAYMFFFMRLRGLKIEWTDLEKNSAYTLPGSQSSDISSKTGWQALSI